MTTQLDSILFITEFYPPHVGGVEMLFAEIAEELARRGHRVGVITSRVPGSVPREIRNGVEVRRVWVPPIGTRYFFTFLGVVPVLIFGRGFTIFQTTVYNAALPAALAGFILRKKVFVVVHEVWDTLWFRLPGLGFLAKRLFYTFERLILALPFQKFICVSQNTLDSLRQIKPSLTPISQLIYNGVDYTQPVFATHPSSASPGAVKTVLFYGRPGISKGVERMIASINQSTNTNLKIRLLLSRDEPKRYELLKAMLHNPCASIEPSLPRPELFQAIADADYVVIPSLCEGFGFAALEACIMGKPVICSNQGSLPEVVYGHVAFYNPWHETELTSIIDDLERVTFEQIPPKKFPIQQTVEEYLALY